MKKIKLLLNYYLSIAPVTLALTAILIYFSSSMGFSFLIPSILAKLFLLSIIWFSQWTTNRKKENLYFYFNNGISQKMLYGGTIFIDIAILVIITFVIL